MRTIGLIGGMSWESTALYYRFINRMTADRLGGLHSAPCLIHSLDFHEIEEIQKTGDWNRAGEILASVAERLQGAGADCLLICANTMHKLADEVEHAVDIPLLHIAEVTGAAVAAAGVRKVGLLGTRYTMEENFFLDRLNESCKLDVMTPHAPDRQFIHDVIYKELCFGRTDDSSRKAFIRIARQLSDSGAEGLILGCTEIGLLLKQADVDLPLFDTTQIHAEAAVEWALASDG